MSVYSDAKFAEAITSPEFRGALNAAWEQDPELYREQQLSAENILYEVQRPKIIQTAADWEARRLAALSTMNGVELGAFEEYIHSKGGNYNLSTLRKENLDMGEPGPVKTNSIIKGVYELYEDPIDFLDYALERIADRRKEGPNTVGPENFATALKYFADMYGDFPSLHLDQDKITELVTRCVSGFALIASKDKPNFVEMTNIYHSIRSLPKGTFPLEFTKTLIEHSLEQLPTYDRKIFPVMFGALARIPKQVEGNEMATLIDLAMRQFGNFETTQEMRSALRVIGNLNQSPESNRTFKTFLESRNNLEEPMDINGLDETNELLLHVIKNVIDDPELTLRAQEMAKTCATRSIALYRQTEAEGELSEAQLQDLRSVVDRVVNNYSQI